MVRIAAMACHKESRTTQMDLTLYGCICIEVKRKLLRAMIKM